MDNEKKELNEEIEKIAAILDAANKDMDVAASNGTNITNALIVGNCIFYIVNVKLTEAQRDEIKLYQERKNSTELCQEMFQRENVGYFKLDNETQQIFYKEVNREDIKKEINQEANKEGNEEDVKKEANEEASEDEIFIEGTSEECDTLYLKLIKYHTGFIKRELEVEKKKQEKSNEKELSADYNDLDIVGGLPPKLISEYARIKNGGQVIKTIKVHDEDRFNEPCLLIVDSIEKPIQEKNATQEQQQRSKYTLLNVYSSTTISNNNDPTIVDTNPTTINSDDNRQPTTIQTPIGGSIAATKATTTIGNDNNNNKSKSFDGYIMGTSSHVSSFLLKSNIKPKKYYLFDTTGHTHQHVVTVGDKQNPSCYYKTQLQLSENIIISDKDAVSLFTNADDNDNAPVINPIDVISLNPFGLDYQNNSSACGIWSSHVSVEALKYDRTADFIIEDTVNNFAMFKSEFILKVAARVTKWFNGANAEIQQEEIDEIQQTEGKVNEKTQEIRQIQQEADLQVNSDNSNNEEDNSDDNKHKGNDNGGEDNSDRNNGVIAKRDSDIKKEVNNTTTYCKCKIGNTLFLIDTQYKLDSCLNMDSILLSISEEELRLYNKNGINNNIIKKIREVKNGLNKQLNDITKEIEEKENLFGKSSVEEKVSISKILKNKRIKQQELKNKIQHAKTIDRLFRQSKGLDNEQLDSERLLSSEQLNSDQIQNELLDDKQSSNKQLDRNQIQNEEELEMQQPEQLQQLQKEEKKQQDIQLEKWGKLDQKKLSSSMEKVLLEMKEKLNSRGAE